MKLMMCARASVRFASLDAGTASHLKKWAGDMARFLNGCGRSLVVTFECVDSDEIDAERSTIENIEDIVARLPEPDDQYFDVSAQQSNLRLRSNQGAVNGVEQVPLE